MAESMKRPGTHRSEAHQGNDTSRLNWLRAGVLGANDGIVATSGLVIGVAASGAGSAALLTAGMAGLAAGAPTIVCPFFGDQPFWGRRVAALGVGTAPIPQKKLTAERLAAALRTVTGDAALRDRAQRLGATLRTEDGIGNAVRLIENLPIA